MAALIPLSVMLSACSQGFRDDDLRGGFDAHETELAAMRLQERVPVEELANPGLFIYVDKADSGPLAQRMVVFQRMSRKALAPLYIWPVSTGREDVELDAQGRPQTTVTPEGLFALNPKRMYLRYVSTQWAAAMPFAMFLAGGSRGLAIHAADGEDVGRIGARASAGCIRLAPEHARLLFDLVRAEYRSNAHGAGGADDSSLSPHDIQNRLKRSNGFGVLVAIDNYPGETFASLADSRD